MSLISGRMVKQRMVGGDIFPEAEFPHYLIPVITAGRFPQQAEAVAVKAAHKHFIGKIGCELIELLMADRPRQCDMRFIATGFQLEGLQYLPVQIFHRFGIRYIHIQHVFGIALFAMINAGSIDGKSALITYHLLQHVYKIRFILPRKFRSE